MKPITIKTTCTVLLGAALIAWGQDRTPQDDDAGGAAPGDVAKERTFGNGVLSENVAMFDVDNSGGLSIEEYQALQASRTQQGRHNPLRNRWDLNRDGQIDAREREAATRRIREIIEERRCRRFNEVDLNSDGLLTLEEFLRINAVNATDLKNPGVAEEIFKHLDRNQDRHISKEEFLRSLDPVRPDPIDPDPTPTPRDDTDKLDQPVRSPNP